MKQKILKVGNSLGVTIPANFVKTMGITAGNQVAVKMIPEKGKVVYSFAGIRQLPLSDILIKK